ncbi:MAG: hypothetical protein K8R35_01380, partial [Bacteroidales bacterium]|nr:hypothetical protein [Bacteroidales bacterium]
LFNPLSSDHPDDRTNIIIVIPAFNEQGITDTLNSLNNCIVPRCKTEVLILVNAPCNATGEQIRHNQECVANIESWKRLNNDAVFQLFFFDIGLQENKEWGAGSARKVIMDEALFRFNILNRHDGIIVSLDADCTLSENYLQTLCEKFYYYNKRRACSLYFEHPIEGDQFTNAVYDAIIKYELHLRYYYQSLKFTGFPYVYHTVGSSLAVRAEAYMKAGGMSRKQAGEDFYFVQKIIPSGGYFYLNDVVVRPSPRLSGRVPFGTGPALKGILSDENNNLVTYNPDAFIIARELFRNVEEFYQAGDKTLRRIIDNLDKDMAIFLEINGWRQKVEEVNRNTSNPDSFKKRFFSWFNMFKMVKYLNWIHSEGSLVKTDILDASVRMLELTGFNTEDKNERDMLIKYRSIERESAF